MGNREIYGESVGKIVAYENRYGVYLGVEMFWGQAMMMATQHDEYPKN